MKLLNGLVLVGFGLAMLGNCIYQNYKFDLGCEGRLKRAADANTIEIASAELTAAIDYLEKNDMTSGYTSIVYRTPDEDIGFWYRNLKSSLEELNKERERPDASMLEKSNMLLKLRETILDHDKGKETVTHPEGMSRYPSNAFWAFVNMLALISTAIGVIMIIIWLEENDYINR